MSKRICRIVENDDNSLKQMFDRFYVIPKDWVADADDKLVMEKYCTVLSNEYVAMGRNGYIVFRGKKPKKLTPEQIAEIKSDTVSTQRELALKYNCSHATINKIKNNKY
ncbi:hypothetical protein [Clostridium botulinum]|uniref:hypothetical protein n=1 Tax=Clostridium botulinum TaxID=1491 RepID=UPI000A4EE087|nr:hypothetical protein [Clostridium botulinum]